MPTTWGACPQTSCPRGEHAQGGRGGAGFSPGPSLAPHCRSPHIRVSRSLRRLFPSGGSVRGCVKGIKALGKYVDLKRLNTTGISAGCTADLLVSPNPPRLASRAPSGGRGPHSHSPRRWDGPWPSTATASCSWSFPTSHLLAATSTQALGSAARRTAVCSTADRRRCVAPPFIRGPLSPCV